MSPWVTLSVAVLFVSFGSILVRLAAAPALAVSFYRLAFASLLLLPACAALPGAEEETKATLRDWMTGTVGPNSVERPATRGLTADRWALWRHERP